MASFMYGLRAPDTKRQYPRRFQYFLNFLTLAGTLEEQAEQFTLKARENSHWAQESLMSLIEFQKKGSEEVKYQSPQSPTTTKQASCSV